MELGEVREVRAVEVGESGRDVDRHPVDSVDSGNSKSLQTDTFIHSQTKSYNSMRADAYRVSYFSCIRQMLLANISLFLSNEKRWKRAGLNFLGPRAKRAENRSKINQKKEEK